MPKNCFMISGFILIIKMISSILYWYFYEIELSKRIEIMICQNRRKFIIMRSGVLTNISEVLICIMLFVLAFMNRVNNTDFDS